MADNIKIVGNVNNIQRISRFKTTDTNLLSTNNILQNFGNTGDFIELFIYDEHDNILSIDYNYTNYKLPSNQFLYPNSTLPEIQIDPSQDIQDIGYNNGSFRSQYSFFKRKFSNSNNDLFITEISQDRTEIRINSVNLTSSELVKEAQNLINELTTAPYQKYYIINFNTDIQQTIINIAIDNTTDIPSILFKLYEPLSVEVFEKDTLWVTDEIIEPYVFGINLDLSVIPSPLPQLRGPNFSIELDIKQNIATKYENYSSLVSSLTGSSYQKILNYMNDNSYNLNIDYTSFDNFIHFSSAEKRLEIFYNKIKQIEDYNNNINILTGSTSLLKNTESSSIKLKIDSIITNFDGFEKYLYFESSSYTWPKLGNNKPYNLLSTSSITSINWFVTSSLSASIYDNNNLDHLYNILPEYIKNDSDNYQPYYNFIDMIGHYFDNIWIYVTSINELYNADNNAEKGISKDIVYDALKSLGVKLYNSKGNDNFNDYISGLNSGSILFNDNFSVTSSFLNNISKKDLLAETYKRIYHNLILLNKNKGTVTGLQNFLTLFGVTGSIIEPKEFGGSTKTGILKGYDNDKITIQNNTITGSVLSSFISLQQPFTSSNNFTSTDLHFVDLSFSPQNQLNSRISASVATTFPTFSIDDYIGDPRLYSSSSYNDLDIQKDRFISASAASATSGSAKRLDYKGFFELVKYFDNSLFKMLKDFVPARTNALTGITIKSPVLERNKISTYRPNIDKQTTYDAKYSGPVISEDNDYIYDKLTGNKSSFYDGIITGSYISIDNYFTNSNPNPYLFPTSSIDVNLFNHTDFNVTLNNVSASRNSVNRYKLEDIYTNISKYVFKTSTQYSSSAELQDSYGSLLGHSRSRYDGTKLSSVTYNTYTSASSNYGGDNSYGKTAVIDHYTRKIGLFTQVEENKLFTMPKRNNLALKYLVDESGSLTELNKKNKHWCEVQNIFKTGNNLAVSLFDNQKSSNQKKTDGIKPIFNSGYSYFPILYASNTDTKLYFNYAGVSTSKKFLITTIGGSISTNQNDRYPIITTPGDVRAGNIPALFRKNPDIGSLDGVEFYNAGGTNNFSTYSIQETSAQSFTAKFDVNVNFAAINQSASFDFKIKQQGVGDLVTQSLVASSGYTSTVYSTTQYPYAINANFSFQIPDELSLINPNGTFYKKVQSGTTLHKIIAYPDIYFGDDYCSGIAGVEFYLNNNDFSDMINGNQSACTTPQIIYDFNVSEIELYTLPVNTISQTLNFNLTTPYKTYTAGDRIIFTFTTGSIKFGYPGTTATVDAGGLLYNQLVIDQSGPNPYATSSVHPFISGSNGVDTLIFNSSLSNFKDYEFIPSSSGNYNSLYTTYKDIQYPFSPKSGDVIIVYYGGDGSFIESTIANAAVNSNGSFALQLTNNLPNSLTGKGYSLSLIDKWVILSKVDDETNILLTFDKPAGSTSYGFVIPNNLHPDMLKNIDTITKEVKQKLIDMGSINGGIF